MVKKRKRKTFVSFHTKDRHAKELLLAQAKNKNINLNFSNQSPSRPFSKKWKTRMKKKICNSSATVVMIGRDTHKRKAINWEVEQSRKCGNKVVGVQIHKNKRHRIPSSLRKKEVIRWKLSTLKRRLKKRK